MVSYPWMGFMPRQRNVNLIVPQWSSLTMVSYPLEYYDGYMEGSRNPRPTRLDTIEGCAIIPQLHKFLPTIY